MKKIKFVFMLSLILSALCLTSCSERIDAGSEGILVNLYGSDKGVDDVSLVTGRVWYNPFTEGSMNIQRSFRPSTTLHSPSTPRMAPSSLWILQCH